MVRLEVEVSKDLPELSFYELEALAELINGSIDMVEYGNRLVVDYRGDLDKLKNILCRAALIKQVDVVHGNGTRKTLIRLDRSRYSIVIPQRNSHGGMIELRIARTLVNLARTNYGSVFLDPFVGSGIIAYEAAMVGARALGIDLNKELLINAASNFLDVINSNSMLIPLRNESIDSIATDPPYGRLSITNFDINLLYRLFAKESYRVLRKNGFLVFSCPTYINVMDWFLNEGFELMGKGLQVVHGSLTRLILIFKKI